MAYRSNPTCLDCGIKLKNHYAIRCKSCNGKINNPMKGKFGPKNPTWEGGPPKCIDCGKQLVDYKAKRCHSCAAKYFLNKPEFKVKLIERTTGSKNGMFGKHHSQETIRKILKKSRRYKSPNKLEKDFILFLSQLNLNKYIFTGNGTFFINNFNPDFVNEKEHKIIELYGDYWHRNDTKHPLRMKTYTKSNFDTLVIYESEFRKDIETVKRAILSFEELPVYG